ncbi:hypothetical protein AB0G79_00900 [Streptomyces sp. NPDC020807]|uniref:hypothetical protein n=1 Tax=Streptomyces sp. NPDC020807 TaxID=3155119 RepID=UPI0034018E8F
MSPVMSPAKLRMAGLGTAVAVAVLLPIVAVAGPSGEPAGSAAKSGDLARGAGDQARMSGDQAQGSGDHARGSGDGKSGDLLSDLGGDLGLRTPKGAPSAAPASTPPVPHVPKGPVTPVTPPVPERLTRCGPELASPEGVEAQTCVLSEGPDVWARTYYRNATGQELDAFLTLMAPGGRTVQVRCAVAAQDEPGTCETPRERRRGGAGDSASYAAVAEFAGTGEGDNTPLLLRSGSNAAESEGS